MVSRLVFLLRNAHHRHLNEQFNFKLMEINLPLVVPSDDEDIVGGNSPASLYAELNVGERIIATPLSPRLDLNSFNP